jgi:hypothetical protein
VEGNIVPLVFVLSQLGIQTCWSCEGHVKPDGRLLRVPQVWFYASSLVYPKLIMQYLSSLVVRHVVQYPWHVTLVELGQQCHDLTITFALKPDLVHEADANLVQLQSDVQVIAENMSDFCRGNAQDLLYNLESGPHVQQAE